MAPAEHPDPFAAPPSSYVSAPPPTGAPVSTAPPSQLAPPVASTQPPSYAATTPYLAGTLPPPSPVIRPTKAMAHYLLWATGGTVVLLWLGAFSSHHHVGTYAEWPSSSAAGPMTPTILLTLLWMPALLAAYVGFGLWMQTVALNLQALQRDYGVQPHRAWWSWFVPFAWLVLPYGMMRDLANSAGARGSAGWWFFFLASYGSIVFAMGPAGGGFDGDGSQYVTASYLAAVSLTASWVFLRKVVLVTTAEHARQWTPRKRPTAESLFSDT